MALPSFLSGGTRAEVISGQNVRRLGLVESCPLGQMCTAARLPETSLKRVRAALAAPPSPINRRVKI